MKKKSKSKSSAVPRVDPYLEGLMAKLLERLVSLEKKMDLMLDQSKLAQNPEAKQPPRRDRQLYEAICADCHQVCEVPFRPSEVRPVYCKECFAKRKAGGSGSAHPILTPVAMPSKTISKPPLGGLLSAARESAALLARSAPKKSKKSQPAKTAKKKK